MRYFRFRSQNAHGDFPEWGQSWWMTEYDSAGWPLRVMYLYDNGNRLRYFDGHDTDDYGGILATTLAEAVDAGDEEVMVAQFEAEWERGPWLNQCG